MKKIFLISCYIVASVVMVSCTNDEVETIPKINKKQITADGDGQSGQTPTTPPK